MKPVRNMRCPGCKDRTFVGYDGEASEVYCADCAQAKAMEYFALNPKHSPTMLPTYMFENVMDEMSRFMGREVAERPRKWQKPKAAPPPTTEWIRPSKAEGRALFVLGVMAVLSFGFILGFLVRGAS